ncbi:SprT family protein [Sporosarcina sp. ACRSM]|uniref:SprT family protein n=1 Tax=Sporosarcina sp. ACRSM TaxID=2918216 RepID=UPI001EF56ACB|nr:SprT family protein [Sporosarcina sp. ACRSM]MCG7336800.1 SprT family protein [Sporosarcina sp. ACRSM]
MTDEELKRLIEKTSLEYFGKPFLHEARFNGRLRTTGGRYMLADHSIEINPLVVEIYGMEELVGVIKHELCHYHLHIEGKGYRHRDADFKKLLQQTASPRFCRPLAQKNQSPRVFRFYRCTSCGVEYKRKRRMDVQKYRCGICKGSIAEV